MRALAAIAAVLLLAVACAHGGEAGASRPPDGGTLYRRSCASCHRLKDPSEHDAATWRRAVEKFGFRLPPEERAAIGDWLAARAKDAPGGG